MNVKTIYMARELQSGRAQIGLFDYPDTEHMAIMKSQKNNN